MNENDVIEQIFGKEIEEMKKTDKKVDTLKYANWCATTADSAFKKIVEAEQMKEEAMARINEWYEEYTEEYTDTIKKMGELLEPWIWDEIKDKQSKSVKLLNGVAGFRKTPGSISLSDGMVEEAKKLGIDVRVKEHVNKTDVKKYIEKTGHIPDNATVIHPVEKFYLKTKEEE